MRRARFTSILLLVVCLSIGTDSLGGVAIDITVGNPAAATGTPGINTTQGWEFIPNMSITVTHLGLYDYPDVSGAPDGFLSEHPIGLWRLGDGSLLTSETVPAGTVAPLLDEFRYVDVADVALDPGVNYAIGFYTPATATASDRLLTNPSEVAWTVDPAIDYVQARWFGFTSDLTLPSNVLDDSVIRFGPNFQFTETAAPIPVPSAVLLGAIGAGLVGWLRRHRTI